MEKEDIFMLAVRFPRSTEKRPDRVPPGPDVNAVASLDAIRFLVAFRGTAEGARSLGPFLP
jgi:hypothetical protein